MSLPHLALPQVRGAGRSIDVSGWQIEVRVWPRPNWPEPVDESDDGFGDRTGPGPLDKGEVLGAKLAGQ